MNSIQNIFNNNYLINERLRIFSNEQIFLLFNNGKAVTYNIDIVRKN